MEAKQIVSYLSAVFSYSSKLLFLKKDTALLIFPAVGKSFANIICLILVIIRMKVLSEKRKELS